jgi:hypothetical protein
MAFAEILIPAVINLFLVVVVLVASARSLALGVTVSGLIVFAAQMALWFWPSPGFLSSRSKVAEFATDLSIVVVTFAPGAILALVAGRRPPSARLAMGNVAGIVSLFLGCMFMLTTLGLACAFLGDCL